jgi:hypothetical protein
MTDPTLPDDDPLRTWAGRVSYSAQGGFAFRPNQVLGMCCGPTEGSPSPTI